MIIRDYRVDEREVYGMIVEILNPIKLNEKERMREREKICIKYKRD